MDLVRFAKAEQAAGQNELKHVFGETENLADSPNELFHLATQLVEQGRSRPSLYQWCGTEDFLYADNVHFRDHAEFLDLAVTYEEGPGGHDWSCWDAQIQRVIAWLPGIGKR